MVVHMLGKVVLAAMLLFGIVWTAVAWYLTKRSARTRSWPTTTGTVLNTEVQRNESNPGGGIRVGYAITYEPIVRYEYSVGDTKYDGDTMSLAAQPGIPDNAGAEAILAQYPVGRSVPVYYDPASPQDSVLVPGGSKGNAFFLGFGIALILASIAGIFIL